MKLNEQYIHGALMVETKKTGLLPRRFTEEQLDGYRVTKEVHLMLARGCAGVTVEFETNARWVELSLWLRFLRPGRQLSFSLYVDGKHSSTRTFSSSCEERMIKLHFPLPDRQCQAQIYLDPLAILELTDITFSADAAVKPLPRRKGLYMAFGDSITQGMQAADSPGRPYPMQIARALHMELLNLGICGGSYQPNIVRDVGLCPSLITVAYGVNDRSLVKTRTQFEMNVSGFFENLTALYPGIPTFVVLPMMSIRDEDTDHFITIQEIRLIIRDIVRKYPELHVLPGQSFMPLDSYYFRDGLHPTDAGFDRITDCLLEAIKRDGHLIP